MLVSAIGFVGIAATMAGTTMPSARICVIREFATARCTSSTSEAGAHTSIPSRHNRSWS